MTDRIINSVPFYRVLVLFYFSYAALYFFKLPNHILEPCLFSLFCFAIFSMTYAYPALFKIDLWSINDQAIGITLHSTLFILMIMTVIKYLVIPSDQNLFSGRLLISFNTHMEKENILYLLAYSISCPFQEWFARGIIQKSLTDYFMTQYRACLSILLSSILFAMYHSYMSLPMVGFALLLGMYWGILYHRYRCLFSLSISHSVVGIWALYILGFDEILYGL